jgi:hypothetical protein
MTANELKKLIVEVSDCQDIKKILIDNWHLKSNPLKDFSIKVAYKKHLEMVPHHDSGPNFYGSMNVVFGKSISEYDLTKMFEKIGISVSFITWSAAQESHDEGKVGRPKKNWSYICVVSLDPQVWRGLSAQHMYSILKDGEEDGPEEDL